MVASYEKITQSSLELHNNRLLTQLTNLRLVTCDALRFHTLKKLLYFAKVMINECCQKLVIQLQYCSQIALIFTVVFQWLF